MKKTSIGKLLRRRREELDNMRRDRIAKLAKILEISPLVIMGAEEFNDKPATLSFDQATLLSYFDDMSQEGKEMALGLIRSLRIAHPKQSRRTAMAM